jgi:hypothetical protein
VLDYNVVCHLFIQTLKDTWLSLGRSSLLVGFLATWGNLLLDLVGIMCRVLPAIYWELSLRVLLRRNYSWMVPSYLLSRGQIRSSLSRLDLPLLVTQLVVILVSWILRVLLYVLREKIWPCLWLRIVVKDLMLLVNVDLIVVRSLHWLRLLTSMIEYIWEAVLKDVTCCIWVASTAIWVL